MSTATILSPPALNLMAGRRVPLASIPQVINSPNRVAPVAGAKRSRPLNVDLRDLPHGQLPPAKRQQRDADDLRRQAMLKKPAGPTALQRKLEAAKSTRQSPQKGSQKTQKADEQSLDNIRQWQQHYKKVFPKLVVYFESVPDDARAKISRQIQSLGAREEIFFSKVVTHVVTTRAIPAEVDAAGNANSQQPEQGVQRTINPLLLETQQHRGRYTFDAARLTRNNQTTQSVESRGRPNNDILHKAQEMNMKIWTLEKLQRMMHTMFNYETGEQAVLTANGRPNGGNAPARSTKHAELSQLLQNEKIYGTVDREWMSDMVPFRGLYVYVHDMDEKTRPALMRDYLRPTKQDQGKWPQLRVSAPGRCPFLEDPDYNNRMVAEQRQAERKAKQAPRTRAEAVKNTSAILAENKTLAKQNALIKDHDDGEMAKPLDPPKSIPLKRCSTDTLPLFGSAQINRRPQPRYAGGEPVASGVQPSNITSAIKSQMISSTAAAPGAKAGSSKELNVLKRKVLEKNNAHGSNSITNSYLNDVRAAINNERSAGAPKGTKRKADALTHIEEEDAATTEAESEARVKAIIRKKKAEKEAKPGYCENCREKFEDFDTHVISRKHRKFAVTIENWSELDDLLDLLVRPTK